MSLGFKRLNRDVVTAYALKEGKRIRGIAVVIPNLGKRYESWNYNSGNYLFTTDTK